LLNSQAHLNAAQGQFLSAGHICRPSQRLSVDRNLGRGVVARASTGVGRPDEQLFAFGSEIRMDGQYALAADADLACGIASNPTLAGRNGKRSLCPIQHELQHVQSSIRSSEGPSSLAANSMILFNRINLARYPEGSTC